MPLISVITPVYNAAAYLARAADSLRAQTLTDWELLLIDDGSTDDSPALCDRLAAQDNRIRAVHQPNRGVSAARNAGLDAARGQYLAFLDADDWVEPDFLAVLLQLLRDTGADLSICCVEDPFDWNEKVQDGVVSVQELRAAPSRYANPVFTNYLYNKLYRADLVRKNCIRLPDQVRRCEDAWFVQDYLLVCQSAAVTTRRLYHYVQNDGSAMHRFYEGVCRDEVPLMRRQYALFHPAPLAEAEEQAFQVWQFGKVLAVLRYIADYAPDGGTAARYMKEFLCEPLARQCFLHPPRGVGRRALVWAAAARCGAYGALRRLLRSH